MKKVKKYYEKVNNCFTLVGGIITFALCLLLVVNILCRGILNDPIDSAVETVQYGMLLAVCLAIGKATYDDGHIKVELLFTVLPDKVGRILKLIVQVLSAAVCAFFVYVIGGSISDVKATGRESDILGIPQYVVYLVLTIGIALVVISLLFRIVEIIKSFRTSSEEESIEKGGE